MVGHRLKTNKVFIENISLGKVKIGKCLGFLSSLENILKRLECKTHSRPSK